MKAETAGKKSGKLRRAATVVLTMSMFALAVLAFLFRDKLSGEGLRDLIGRTGWAKPSAQEAFSFETGSEQVFALAGDGLAVASSTGFHLLDERGETVAKQVLSLGRPAVAASPRSVPFMTWGEPFCAS